ncbi:FG-GAP repeat domain-containing protein [Glycomyces tarimensis]
MAPTDQAFEIASACEREVRIDIRSWPHLTVTATPDGLLHVVSAVGGTGQHRNDGAFDATIAERDGRLVQSATKWEFRLRHTGEDVPLIDVAGVTLDWTGEAPVPSYSGATAVYDDLTAGLDLRVDLDISSAGLAFTAEDPEAWDALTSGLTAQGGSGTLRALDGALRYNGKTADPLWIPVRTTPFTVRDAEGAISPVGLALDEAGSLSVDTPAEVLDTAAFPLTLSTQWTYLDPMIGHWGSVTSAAPDLALYRGQAGMESAYFEVAGEGADAVVGTYCDAVVAPDCPETAAATYWKLPGPDLPRYVVPDGIETELRVVEAEFKVDAADGATCAAPELHLTDGYEPDTVWSALPTATGASVAGACLDGSAVYDVSDIVGGEWSGGGLQNDLTFGMTESADTARFRGGSGRLDVYFDPYGVDFDAPELCGWSPDHPDYTNSTSLEYGGFRFETWPPATAEIPYTWTATFSDAATGATLFTTEEREVLRGDNPIYRLSGSDALGDGRYLIQYEFASAESDSGYEPDACSIVKDSADPEIVDISVSPSPIFEGDSYNLEVSVADDGFPSGSGTLQVRCIGSVCPDRQYASLTDGTTASFDAVAGGGSDWFNVLVTDEAGNQTDRFGTVWTSQGDYDSDGHEDLYTIRRSDGRLVFHAGRGDGTFASPEVLGTGWGKMDITLAGDVTGDDIPDVVAKNRRDGLLYTYPGDGTGGFQSRLQIDSGGESMRTFTADGDFDGDGHLDLLAIEEGYGTLYLYRGNSDGTFEEGRVFGSGWGAVDTLTTVGDVNFDGFFDLLARDARTGEYFFCLGDGDRDFDERVTLPASLSDSSSSRRYSEIAAAGDLDGDGYPDVAALDPQTGELSLHSFDSNGDLVLGSRLVGDGWEGDRLPSPRDDRTYDFDNDDASDILARRASDGTLFLYPGNGDGSLEPRESWGSSWESVDLIETAGDFNGDGASDVLARDADSTRMYVYLGDGNGGYSGTRIAWGTWSSMSTIVSGHDYNGDGINDVIAVHKSTGYLWLYPGTGDGYLESRIQIGSGWNAMRELTAVGDLNADGNADLIAVRASDGCMFYYAGHGDTTFDSRVQIGCGWNNYDQVTGIGDFNSDGHTDWIARRQTDGNLYLYLGNGAGRTQGREHIGHDWNSMDIIA